MIPWLYTLKEDEQLLVEGFTKKWTVNGPGVHLFPLFLYRITSRHALTLGPTDYARISNTLSGEIRNEVGPRMVFLNAHEQVEKHLSAIPLKKNQYIRLLDQKTGMIRVERGEKSVILGPTEEPIEVTQNGISIDEHNSVLVRDIQSGQMELITKKQVFVPTPHQEIIGVRKRILLEEHETVVVKEKSGKFAFKSGTGAESFFFLEPYDELVQHRWSSGINKNTRNLVFTHIDRRPKFMWYEFEARTQDNVELVIGITFFWQIVKVESMIQTTDDTPGDLCSHARSLILQSVSQVTLEKFLSGFNTIVGHTVLQNKDNFYEERGVKLHAVEVRSVACKNSETQNILQEIIQETTRRLNRLQKQDSDNEVKIKKIKGDTEAELMKKELFSIKKERLKDEARLQGQAEAERIHAFFEGLTDTMDNSDKLSLFTAMQKKESLEKLSQGTAQIYFTPNDVDLTIESRHSPKK